MKDYLIIDLWQKENTHWWHIGKRKIVLSLIKKFFSINEETKILEIGSGSGKLLEEISKFSKNVSGIDISEKAVDFCINKGLKVIKKDIIDISVSENYDIIICLDVLEHCDNDNFVLEKIYNLLKENGILILSVPAYQWLWSYWDNILNHKRRYSYRVLKSKLKSVGFNILKLSYSNFFIFPAVVIYRLIRKIIGYKKTNNYTEFFTIPKLINLFLLILYDFESFLLTHINLPFGLSIICITKKEQIKIKNS